LKKRIIVQEEIPAKHSESDKSLQPRILAEPEVLKNENEEETDVSISGSTLPEIQELNTTNMA